MKTLNFKHLFFSMFAVLTISTTAQQTYSLDLDKSKLTISGTSSMHDWEMEAETFSAQVKLKLTNEAPSDFQSVNFSCKVDDIESGKRIMDGKAHDALQEKKHPIITFQLTPSDPVNMNGATVILTGSMMIAGNKKDVTVNCIFKVNNEDQFSVSGQVPIKMSDFGIEPPTAMLGALETGDEVVVKFDFRFTVGSEELSGL